MLVFVEPYGKSGHAINFITEAEATRISWSAAGLREKGKHSPYTDEMALADFKTVHWADTIEQTIEKMAKAMWTQWATQSGENIPCLWEQVVRKPWQEQARAALKSLGVLL